MQYLHPKKYYIDLYDLFTIKECLDWYWRLRNGMEKNREKLAKSSPETDFDHEVNKCCSYTVNVMKGERYRRKADTLNEWIKRDQKRQNFYNNTPAPEDITCEHCYSPTKIVHKHFDESTDGKTMRIAFMYECLKCQKKQSFYNDGSPWDFQRERCKKCDVELKIKCKRDKKKDILTITDYCPKCSYKKIHVMDHKKDRESLKKMKV